MTTANRPAAAGPPVYLATLGAMLCWSLSFIWTKVVYGCYRPLTVITLRLALATALLWLVTRFLGPREAIAAGDRRHFLLLAFLEPFCYFLGESFGLLYVSSSVASVLVATIPLATALAAVLLLRERLSRLTMAGLAVSFGGVALIALDGASDWSASGRGFALMALAVAAAAGYGLVLRRLSLRYSSLTVVRYQNMIGLLYFLPLFLLFDAGHFAAARPASHQAMALVLLAVFPSTLAFVLLTTAVRALGIARVNLFTYLIPALTAGFSFLLLDERFSAAKLAGMAVVIGGLLLSELRPLGRYTVDLISRFDR
ncbi:MAG: DMT family transporter [Candidatus Edwardsbacteria bacterium]|jgi:drug/metabolite transporter (DMT)-like permease|nr:DMT family transporter [Candidatus Edwardsbacteria bacterium]